MIRAFVVQWRTLCMMYDDTFLEMFNISREIVSIFIIMRIRIRFASSVRAVYFRQRKGQ